MSYIGVDLHTTQITVCYLKAKDEFEMKKYHLCEIDKFISSLQAADEIAVEATGNTRWFYEQVRASVSRVVLVNPRQFEVVKNSVKKTDKRDTINLARFLKADLLPEVRAKAEEATTVQSLVQTRTKLVRLKTSLVNKIHGLAVANGRRVKENEFVIGERLGKSLGSRVERD